ncbi:hypothetical protein P280DRAFT_262340 [Massarina eburnea CBS 473.64]|uniref:Uncharacterized protein n=1 Tax=Massarina eburnea CBS 473.64 TaxID=1395130 RepID=A0A6A6S3W1_9PLEO|nr:hypothetical protein P280DRAFT_262340 [Massarina eburnea CBS 473.64]
MVHSHRQAHRQFTRRENGAPLANLPTRTEIMERSRVIVARSTCTNDTDDGCRLPTVTPTLPIILGVVIPIVVAAVVMVYLHRRNIKKLQEEDARDKYKSLDFGMDPSLVGGGASRGAKGPEMKVTEKTGASAAHMKGLSLDMDVEAPYILPAGLHGSHESLHSLSRSTQDPHDPYRPVTFINGDGSSIRSDSRTYKNDNGSMYTTSSGGTDRNGLLKNASNMPKSAPPRVDSDLKFPEPIAVPLSPLNPRTYDAMPPPLPPPSGEALPATPLQSAAPLPLVQEARATANASPRPMRIQSQQAVVSSKGHVASFMSDSSFGEGFQITPPSPTQPSKPVDSIEEEPATPAAPQPRRSVRQSQALGLGIDASAANNPNRLSSGVPNSNRLSMSLRPLPHEDPNEDPEQRANRIRSFYKEYFDDSKPEPAGNMYPDNDQGDDYTSEYLDGTVFDPHSGQFVVAHAQGPQAPFAQPVTRRAMTPPPRAPPRFRSDSSGPRSRRMSNGSMASSAAFPPRNMSSLSGQMSAPRKPLPPPVALSSLPTPGQLKDDTAIFNAMDFAPPVSYRERQNGMRPDSPLGNPRPFSPSVRAASPMLASAYDELPVMPSPHLLRNSTTFTALDFAPPPRFRDDGNMSDAGSIHSNRSGMSQAGRFAIRNGANRVSKIPADMVTTKDDLANQLRPQMDMVGRG